MQTAPFLFRSSLAIVIILVLVSFFGGAPTSAEAAPKPSKTPRPTRTAGPVSTFTPVPTFTFTPEPTLTFTPEPTFTFTPTATATPCAISANIFPPSGFVTPGDVELFASDANNCGVPVEYHWDCGSPTGELCSEFLATVNVPPYNHQFLTINVNIDGIIDIAVYVCLPGDYDINPILCSAAYRTYQAQEI